MDRVSVPLWLAVLSDQLSVIALVSHYLTNKLIDREIIQKRSNHCWSSFSQGKMPSLGHIRY